MNNPWHNIATPTHELNVRRVSDTHPLPLFWGKDARGGYLFVVQIAPDSAPEGKTLPKLEGVKIAVVRNGVKTNLVLLLNETANWELFLALCNDLTRATENTDSDTAAVAMLIRRLARWHEFLKRERVDALSFDAVKGLVGELLFLENELVPRFGWETSVSFWKGPEDAPQDFAVHDTAVEVKCQSGSTKPYVRINSLEQLNAQLPKFFLIVHTLASAEKDTEGSFTPNSLVSRIRSALDDAGSGDVTRELFEALLFQVGYVPLEKYEEYIFQRIATRVFRVTADFPRLAPNSIPDGLSNITYQLRLDACAAFECELQF